MGYDFTPSGSTGTPIHEDVVYELEQFPEDKTEKDLETHVAPAVRAHMKDFLAAIASRGKPVSDIEQGYMSATACILANHSMTLGRSLQWDHAKGSRRRRRRSEQAAPPHLSRPLGAPGAGHGLNAASSAPEGPGVGSLLE